MRLLISILILSLGFQLANSYFKSKKMTFKSELNENQSEDGEEDSKDENPEEQKLKQLDHNHFLTLDIFKINCLLSKNIDKNLDHFYATISITPLFTPPDLSL